MSKKSPQTWIIYLFVSLYLHFVTWNDFTWFDNTVRKCGWVKAVTSQNLGSHFLIVACRANVRMVDTSSFSIEERLVASTWMQENTAQVRRLIKWWHLFYQRFGKTSRRIAALCRVEKAPLHTGMRKVLLGAFDWYP